jgi:hypothetical protein
MAGGFTWNRQALEALERSREVEELVEDVAQRVRDIAESNAKTSGLKGGALVATEAAEDMEGVYADVGYDKHHPDFTDWWHEVGTRDFPPRPHLRPAASRPVI